MKIFIILVVMLRSQIAMAQISPGDLTNAHSHLEGISNCTKCHEIGEKVTNDKCLSCHTEIKSRLESNRGYHSSSNIKNKICSDCHSEHHGRGFQIIRFDKNSFRHEQTGYKLIGKHLQLECGKCHDAKFISDSKLKSRKKTYLGLSPECSNCHQDVHLNSLGSKCNKCHNETGFIKAELFQHSSTKYELTGRHLELKCGDCHKNYNLDKSKITFGISSFNKCIDCHRDVHEGKFGSDCKGCHITDSFQRIINLDQFNHDKTRYPLLGKHSGILCKSCHVSGLNYKPKFERCIDCHDDYHKGQFTNNYLTRDCADCHTVTGFSPSSYTMNDHDEIKFKLTGSHLAVPCSGCHFKNKVWTFRIEFESCSECHENVHGSSIGSKYLKNGNCNFCHNTFSWNNVIFNHKDTGFDLSGKHSVLSCRSCHFRKDAAGNVIHVFTGLNVDCENCHSDNHAGQFVVDGKTDCAGCHGYNSWKIDRFNHFKTRFPLTGAHSAVDCSRCHKSVSSEQSQYIQYKFEDIKCANCHS